MTVSTVTNNVVYRGNGAATNFAVPFKVLDEAHLIVSRRIFATGVVEHIYIGTAYSYSGIGDSSGTLTLDGAALDDDYELVIERIVPYTQDLDLVNVGGFYPDTVEEQLDLIVMGLQQLDDLTDRAFLLPPGHDAPELPPLEPSSVLGTDNLGTVISWLDRDDFRGSTGLPGGNVESIGLFIDAAGMPIPAGTERVRTSGHGVVGAGAADYVYNAAVNAAYVATWPDSAFLAEDGRGFLLDKSYVTAAMFGALNNEQGGVGVDQSVALNKFFAFCAAARVESAHIQGLYWISNTVYIGGAVSTATLRYTGYMDLRAITGSSGSKMCVVRGSDYLHFDGDILCQGTGVNWADRTWDVGLFQEAVSRFLHTGEMRFRNLAFCGFTCVDDATNTSLTNLGHVRSVICGSSSKTAGYSFPGTWTARLRTGSANSLAQRDVLDVSAIPDSRFDEYLVPGQSIFYVLIAGKVYQVMSRDRTAGTISVFPWLPVGATPGAIEYVFGGGVILPKGSDHNVYGIERLDASRCGVGLGIACFYGPVVGRAVFQSNDLHMIIGAHTQTSMLGGRADAYFEDGFFDIIAVGTAVASHSFEISSNWALNLAKCISLAPINASEVYSPSYSGFKQVAINTYGHRYEYDKPERNHARNGSSIDVPLQSGHGPFVIKSDGGTTIRPVVSVDLNRLYGLDSREVIFHGNGAVGEPTGTISFGTGALPGGWTLSGASFTSPHPGGPARFLMWADFDTLTVHVMRSN